MLAIVSHKSLADTDLKLVSAGKIVTKSPLPFPQGSYLTTLSAIFWSHLPVCHLSVFYSKNRLPRCQTMGMTSGFWKSVTGTTTHYIDNGGFQADPMPR